MKLPDDYARCKGVSGNSECEGCLRKQPVSPSCVYYSRIIPAISEDGVCDNRLGPIKQEKSNDV